MIKFLLIILAIAAFHSFLYSQSLSDTSRVLLRFNEPMSRDGIFETNNYKIVQDDLTEMTILKVGVVPGDTAVVLFVNKFSANATYKVIVTNLKDKSGNTINRDYNSFSFTSKRQN